MFAHVLAGLTLVRHAVAITLVLGAATATVAGAVDVSQNGTPGAVAPIAAATTNETTQTNTSDLEASVKACLESNDPASDACASAVALSGLSSEAFWAKLALSFKAQLAAVTREKNDTKTEPKHTPKPEATTPATGELLGLVTACVHTADRTSEPCVKALALSGLPSEEFWAKVGALFGTDGRKTEPKREEKPSTKPTEGSITALIKDCLAKYEVARNTHEGGEAASEACRKAIEASGLSSNDFWAKFAPKPATTPRREPTTRPTPTARPSGTQTVSDEQLVLMVKDCFTKYVTATASKGNEELGHAAYDACTKAIAASGLSNDAFWAKFGTPQAPKI